MAMTTLAPEDVAQIWQEFKQDPHNQDLRNRLVEMYLPLVKYNGERIWSRLPEGVELDDLVSAGVFEPGPLDEMTPEFWDNTMKVNVRGTFLAVQAAAPHLRVRGGGSIVIYTSTAGQRGSDIYSAYATSKGAQILFMRSMAKELGGDKIRVNCIAPAWTETDMAAPSLDELGRESVSKQFVLGRIGQPDDVAGATVYLLSDLAQFVTGMTLTVDGGMDMRG